MVWRGLPVIRHGHPVLWGGLSLVQRGHSVAWWGPGWGHPVAWWGLPVNRWGLTKLLLHWVSDRGVSQGSIGGIKAMDGAAHKLCFLLHNSVLDVKALFTVLWIIRILQTTPCNPRTMFTFMHIEKKEEKKTTSWLQSEPWNSAKHICCLKQSFAHCLHLGSGADCNEQEFLSHDCERSASPRNYNVYLIAAATKQVFSILFTFSSLWLQRSSSNWILMSCQLHRVTAGQSNSGHKQIHISKLFSHIYQPSLKSVYKTSHFTDIKHTQTSDTNFRRVSPFNITPVKRAHKARICWYCWRFHLIYRYQVNKKLKKGMDRQVSNLAFYAQLRAPHFCGHYLL